jgi:hypothetical protein
MLGDNTAPCLTPFLTGIYSPTVPFHFTLTEELAYQYLSTETIERLTPEAARENKAFE